MTSSNGRVPRRRRIPPPILRAPGDASPDDLHILDELPEPQGVVVWSTCRAVTLWAGTPPENRAGLFHATAADARLASLAEAGFPPEADAPLATLAALLAAPAQGDAHAVAAACMSLSRWLERTRAPRSAVSLAQAAALALPSDHRAATDAGEAALRAHALVQAEAWLRRALELAWNAGEPFWIVRAGVRLGEALERMQRGLEARRRYRRALAVAAEHGISSHAVGEAHAALFRQVRDAAVGDYPAARFHAYGALQHLPARAKPAMMHEVAKLWVDHGRPVRAMALLRKLAPHRESREGKLESWTLLAEVAAKAGLRREFDRAFGEGQHLVQALGTATPNGVPERLAAAAARMLASTLDGPSTQPSRRHG